MRSYIGLMTLGTLALMSCSKENVTSTGYTEATYQLTITGQWKAPALSVPVNAHFTPVTGMVHNGDALMFRPGLPASVGAESLAEDGNAFPLLAAIDSMISKKQVSSSFIMFFPQINGSTRTSIYLNTNFSRCSFMSMLAPTPDWFFGAHDFDLRAGGNWISDTTINLYAWDAGTEEGDIFRQDNAATIPQDKVSVLTVAKGSVLANGNPMLAPVAQARFVKQ